MAYYNTCSGALCSGCAVRQSSGRSADVAMGNVPMRCRAGHFFELK